MESFDVVIIGAGPGGVQLALRLEEIKRRTGARIEYCILEKGNAPGHFFSRFPVHGQLISNNKLYSGADPRSRFAERFDWNSLITEERAILTRDYSADFYPRREIVGDMLRDLCARYALPVRYDTNVESVVREEDGTFAIRTGKGPIKSRLVVVATGLKPVTAEIPGIDHATPYAEMRPADHYRDKKVLIIGKGNSGFECANDIINEAAVIMVASRNPVRLAYQTHYVGSVRAVNAQLIENYQLKHHAAILDCDIERIERTEGDGYEVTVAYRHADGEVETLGFDAVIAATGFAGNLDAVDGALEAPLLHGKFPDIDEDFGARGVDGLYFAGALTHGPDYRCFSSSGFIHGFRYNSIVLAHHLAARLGVQEEHLRIAEAELADFVMAEFEEDAAIYLQPGYIGRCLACEADGTWLDLGHRTRRWFDAQPPEDSTLLLATLEYGDIHAFPDMLRIPRYPGDPDKHVHIHPVVRTRSAGGSREVHLGESLLNRFASSPAIRRRLEEFLSAAGRFTQDPPAVGSSCEAGAGIVA
jgi:thioredoxin reductase